MLKIGGLWEPLGQLIPFCGVAVILVSRARSILKPNPVSWIMVFFLGILFVVLLMQVTRRIPWLDFVPIAGRHSKIHHNVISFLLLTAAGSFLIGGYLLLEEILKGKVLLQQQLAKLQQVEGVLAESEARSAPWSSTRRTGFMCKRAADSPISTRPRSPSSEPRHPRSCWTGPCWNDARPYEHAAFEERMHLLEHARKPIPRTEQKYVRLDGTSFEVAAAAAPFTFNGQNSALIFFRDYTERKQLEDQLRQAQKMEAVGQLAGGVAHDFNNLMTVIKGYCGFLEEDKNRTDKLGALKHIAQASRRASELTQQLLTFSRQQVVRMAPLDLNSALHHLQPMLTRLLGENIDLNFHARRICPWSRRIKA